MKEKTLDVTVLRFHLRERMVESAVRAEEAQHPIMRQIYAGQSQAYEDILRHLSDFMQDEETQVP